MRVGRALPEVTNTNTTRRIHPMSAPDPATPRTIVRLEVDSYQRLRAALVTPTPTGLVPVRGRNAQGKSSLIESMLDALGAEKSEAPIQIGQDGAEVVLHLGDDLVVRKRWTRDSGGEPKASLTIEGADGSKVGSPAAVLKSLRGQFADPVAFLDLQSADQTRTVLAVLGLDERLRALELLETQRYDQRREAGREADRLAKAAAEIQREVASLPPPPESSLEALAAQLQAAKDTNARIEALAVKQGGVERRGRDLVSRIAAQEAAVERARAALAQAESDLAAMQAAKVAAAEEWKQAGVELKAAGQPIDTAPIVAAMREHEAAARLQSRRDLAVQLAEQSRQAHAAHAAAEEALGTVRAEIATLLGSVVFPVEGMAYDHEKKTLTIGGVPFGQASQAERLKAATIIAMSGSPSLRVLFVREGSLLDDESRAQVAGWAAERGFQTWMEIVDSKAAGAGVWIEDGQAYQSQEFGARA